MVTRIPEIYTKEELFVLIQNIGVVCSRQTPLVFNFNMQHHGRVEWESKAATLLDVRGWKDKREPRRIYTFKVITPIL